MLARLAEMDEATESAKPRGAAELQLLDGGHDTTTSDRPFASTLVGSKHATTLADQSRLLPPPNPGRNIPRAAQRILSADMSAASPSPNDVRAEARLRHALTAIARVVDFVHIEASRDRRS